MSDELNDLYRQLAEVDERLATRDTDFTINKLGSSPVAEDHGLDAHEHQERLAVERAGDEKDHHERQRLVEQIDRLRLGSG